MTHTPSHDFNRFPNTTLQISTAKEGLLKSKVLSASKCTLIEAVVCNCSGSTIYVQLHNATSLPVDTTVPDFPSYTVPADEEKLLPINHPIEFLTGCVLVASSTDETLTIVGSNAIQICAFIKN